MNRICLYSIALVAILVLTACAPRRGPQTSDLRHLDLLSKAEALDLIEHAKTPADHTKLQRHFLALAAKHDDEAADHEAMARAYRLNPTGSESKRPWSVDTVAHCERYAKAAREAASAARVLAADHERMAAGRSPLITYLPNTGHPARQGGPHD